MGELRACEFAVEREEMLKEMLGAIPSEFMSVNTTWSAYQPVDKLMPVGYEQSGRRAGKILELLTRLQPRRVVDLASNAGFFIFMAARQGANVCAIELDEQAIDILYATAKASAESLNMSCGCFDLLVGFPEVFNQADLVLALALTHHLTLGQGFPFSYVAEMLASYSTEALITEFMPNGLGIKGNVVPDPLPSWYTVENLMACLRRYFASVDVIPYEMEPGHSPRTMVLCVGRRAKTDERLHQDRPDRLHT